MGNTAPFCHDLIFSLFDFILSNLEGHNKQVKNKQNYLLSLNLERLRNTLRIMVCSVKCCFDECSVFEKRNCVFWGDHNGEVGLISPASWNNHYSFFVLICLFLFKVLVVWGILFQAVINDYSVTCFRIILLSHLTKVEF